RGRKLQVALEIKLGIGKRSLVLRFLGQGLVVRGLIGRGIDLGQQEAAWNILPFNKGEREQLAVDLRTDRDGVERPCSSNAIKVDRNIGSARLDRKHRNCLAWRRGAEAALAFALLVDDGLLRRALPRGPIINDACREGQADKG